MVFVCCVCGSKGHLEEFGCAMIYAVLGVVTFWVYIENFHESDDTLSP